MKLKIFTETEVLFDKVVNKSTISEKAVDKIRKETDERDVISYSLEFKKGVKVKAIHCFDDIDMNMVKSLHLKVR